MNYIDFISEKLGHVINEFPLDGKFYRFSLGGKKKKNGWAVGRSFLIKGQEQAVVSFGNFKTGEKWHWQSWDKAMAVTSRFNSEVAKIRKQLSDEIESAKLEEQKNTAIKYSKLFSDLLSESPLHPYLKKKSIDQNYTAKIDLDGVLWVPIYDGDNLSSIQKIWPDGSKKYIYGGKVQSCFCPIGDYKKSKIIYVVEGYATACTIFMATKKPVIAAMSAGNLMPVITSINSINPAARIIIAADRDKSEVGEKEAIKCVDKFFNVSYVLPQNLSGTDFNDLHCEHGIDTVKAQLIAAPSRLFEVLLLGYDRDNGFYYFNPQKSIVESLTPTAHTQNNLMGIASESYWGQKFNCFKGESERVDFSTLANKLMEKQRSIKWFNGANIKTIGVHVEGDSLAVNLGNKIFYKNSIIDIFEAGEINGSIYPGQSFKEINLTKKLTIEDGARIYHAINQINFQNKHDAIILTGWIAIAQIFNVLKWRPHIWLTGERASGKTTVLDTIEKLIPINISITDATRAGLEQELHLNSRAVIMDEAEAGNQRDDKKMAAIMNIIRHCSSKDGVRSIKGTSGGKSSSRIFRGIFLMASIQPPLLNAADKSRIIQLEMKSVLGQTKEKRSEVLSALKAVQHLGHQLLARMIDAYPDFVKKYEQIKNQIDAARTGDNIAPIIAGFQIITGGKIFTDQELIQNLLGQLEEDSDQFEMGDDANDCMDYLLNYMINIPMEETVCDYILGIPEKQSRLESFGMRVIKDDLHIHFNNPQMKRILANSDFKNASRLLGRHASFVGRLPSRIGGVVVKASIFRISKLIKS